MKTFYFILLLTFCIGFQMPVFALRDIQSSKMNDLTIYDGLAGESVYCIYKTKWGIVWIGTTNGMSSFDGYKVKTFRVDDSGSLKPVTSIAQSDDGYIWAATKSGIYRVEGTTPFLTKMFPEIKSAVSALKIIGETMYVGSDEGLYICNISRGKLKSHHVTTSGLRAGGMDKVNDIIVTGNTLWALGNKELYSMSLKTGKIVPKRLPKKMTVASNMRQMVLCGYNIYIGTYNDGLLCYDTKADSLYHSVNVGCKIITCLSSDKDNLYVGTDGAGLSIVDRKTMQVKEAYSTRSDSRYRLKDNTVYAFLHDSTGINFFGYYRQGLHYNYYTKPLFHCYKSYKPGTKEVLFDSNGINIRSICIRGSVKVLGSRGGLYYIDEAKGICKFFTPDELGGSIVTNVVEYVGMYYCSTFNGGVMRIDPKTLTASRFGKHPALRNSSFGALRVSPDGELWMSSMDGVYVYNAKTEHERYFDSRNSQLPDAYCNDLLFDRLGRCWISTLEGLYLYDPDENKIHDSGFPEGFFNNLNNSHGVLGDKDLLLFSSPDGLFYTNDVMTDYGKITKEGISSMEYISQMIYDKRHHRYWFATDVGMFRFDRDMKNMCKFSSEAGLNCREFSQDAVYIDDMGVLWTGTMGGLYYTDLNKTDNYDIGEASIIFDDVYIGGKTADNDDMVQLIRDHSVSIGYHWGMDELEFTPVLLNYCNQEDLCFEYRIGEEGEWKVQKKHEPLIISGLGLGQTILQIRTSGSKHMTTYRLYVFPTRYFILELVAMLIFAIVVAVYLRQRSILVRERQEMMLVQAELAEAKKKYGRVQVTDSEQQNLYLRLDAYMRQDKPYLSSELKLSDIAAHLDSSTVKLSQLFNVYLEKNYYDFVNQYRLEEFKRRLDTPQYKNYTVLALAEECGFKRSAFFAAFKKSEGMTPTEYVKKRLKSE